MEWHLWSGFTGEGVYAIINKESLTSIDLPYGSSTPGTVTQDFRYSPNNGAQLWRFRKDAIADAYAIQNVRGGLLLTATGTEKEIVGAASPPTNPFGRDLLSYPIEALWALDRSLYSLHPGGLIVLRSLKYPGYVMDLHDGEDANGTPIRALRERGIGEPKDMQKWLLQKQSHEWQCYPSPVPSSDSTPQ